MEEDILRQLYEGDYVAVRFKASTGKEFMKADKKLREMDDKLIEIFNKDGSINPTDFLNDWGDAWFTMTNEEMIETYKKGAHFGFQMAIQLSKKIED